MIDASQKKKKKMCHRKECVAKRLIYILPKETIPPRNLPSKFIITSKAQFARSYFDQKIRRMELPPDNQLHSS